jgi:hypothetical protein
MQLGCPVIDGMQSGCDKCLSCTIQGMLLKDVEPVLILRHMAFFATLILLLATATLEGDVLQRLPPAACIQFYAMLVLNCGLAMVSNLLNMLVTRANGALSLQVHATMCAELKPADTLSYTHLVEYHTSWPHIAKQRLVVHDAGVWQPLWRPGNGVLDCSLPKPGVAGGPERVQLDDHRSAAVHEGEVWQRCSCAACATQQGGRGRF